MLAGLDLVLPNGSFVQLSAASPPLLWKAARVSAGRLGVITSVTFRRARCSNGGVLVDWPTPADSFARPPPSSIVPNAQMRRTSYTTNVSSFLSALKAAQDGYNADGVSSPALKALEGTQWMWCAGWETPIRCETVSELA